MAGMGGGWGVAENRGGGGGRVATGFGERKILGGTAAFISTIYTCTNTDTIMN